MKYVRDMWIRLQNFFKKMHWKWSYLYGQKRLDTEKNEEEKDNIKLLAEDADFLYRSERSNILEAIYGPLREVRRLFKARKKLKFSWFLMEFMLLILFFIFSLFVVIFYVICFAFFLIQRNLVTLFLRFLDVILSIPLFGDFVYGLTYVFVFFWGYAKGIISLLLKDVLLLWSFLFSKFLFKFYVSARDVVFGSHFSYFDIPFRYINFSLVKWWLPSIFKYSRHDNEHTDNVLFSKRFRYLRLSTYSDYHFWLYITNSFDVLKVFCLLTNWFVHFLGIFYYNLPSHVRSNSLLLTILDSDFLEQKFGDLSMTPSFKTQLDAMLLFWGDVFGSYIDNYIEDACDAEHQEFADYIVNRRFFFRKVTLLINYFLEFKFFIFVLEKSVSFFLIIYSIFNIFFGIIYASGQLLLGLIFKLLDLVLSGYKAYLIIQINILRFILSRSYILGKIVYSLISIVGAIIFSFLIFSYIGIIFYPLFYVKYTVNLLFIYFWVMVWVPLGLFSAISPAGRAAFNETWRYLLIVNYIFSSYAFYFTFVKRFAYAHPQKAMVALEYPYYMVGPLFYKTIKFFMYPFYIILKYFLI